MSIEVDSRTVDFPDFTDPLPSPLKINNLLQQLSALYEVDAKIWSEAFDAATAFPRFDIYVTATHPANGFLENTDKFMRALHAHVHDFLHSRHTSLPRAVHKTRAHDLDDKYCESEEEREEMLGDVRLQDITTDTMLGKITQDGAVSSLEFSLPYSRATATALEHWLQVATEHPPHIIRGTGQHTLRILAYETPTQQRALQQQQAAQRQ